MLKYKKVKKILITSNTSWNIYNFRKNLIKELLLNGNEVIILSTSDKYTYKLIELGCKFYEIKINRSSIGIMNNIILLFNFFSKIKNIKPDLILSYTIKPNIYASLAANFYRIKIYNTITGIGSSFLKNNFLKFLIINFYFFSLKKSDLIIFQNKDDKALFFNHKILKNQQTDIIPGSGIDTEHFYFDKNKKNNEVIKFLFVGRLIKDKGIVELIEAFEAIQKTNNNVCLLVVGSLDKNNLSFITESKINDWKTKKNFQFLGYIEDIREKIIESDCVILPSYREGMPRSLLEAASMGKPMITTDVPGCREIVSHNITGYLCKSHDIKDLINKMELFLETSNEKRIQMGKNARKIILDRFDQKIIIDKYLGHIIKS